VLVLTNGTLFTRRLLDRISPPTGRPVAVQISLDRPEADDNDLLRAPDNFRKVIQAIPRLVERGHEVRIATTLLEEDAAELARLCDLHRSLDVSDEQHLVRPVVRRGRASTGGMGTVDGAFWSRP
jgi:MoaA/NifB/PqqE/SkfB family radical SAM enzyme